MSEWLMQCYPLLEDLHRRMMRKVLDSGHIYTDDTTLPLRNDDPARRSTVEAKLWVCAKDYRHGPPLIVYDFSRSRTRDAPLKVLADYRGYVQADAYPGYDPLFVTGKIIEVACNVHARRKFVEAADLLEKPGRPHEALAFYRELFRIERKIKDWSDEERVRERQEKTAPLLAQFKAWLDHAVHTVLPKHTFGIAVNYALKHWEALTNFTKAGHLDASNNYAERCMRTVAVGRKAFLFVGSERAGHAAAIYYSLVESCKANNVNPLTYLTYVLANARNKSITLPTPENLPPQTSPTSADALFNNLDYAGPGSKTPIYGRVRTSYPQIGQSYARQSLDSAHKSTVIVQIHPKALGASALAETLDHFSTNAGHCPLDPWPRSAISRVVSRPLRDGPSELTGSADLIEHNRSAR